LAQMGLGYGHVGALGLLVGYVMNTGAACVALGFRLLRRDTEILRLISWTRMKTVFAAYHRFPKYSTLEALSNSAAIQVPVVLIAANATSRTEAGFLILAMNVMQAPMALVGVAISQVYLSRAPEEHRAGRLGPFTVEVFGGLLKAGVGPLLFVGIVAPVIFPIIFGGAWHRAGVLVSWMTPWFVLQFLASPISMAMHVAGKQKIALGLQAFSLFTRIIIVWCAGFLVPTGIAEIYAASGFIIYLIYLVVILRAVSANFMDIFTHFSKSIKLLMLWALLAVCLAGVIKKHSSIVHRPSKHEI